MDSCPEFAKDPRLIKVLQLSSLVFFSIAFKLILFSIVNIFSYGLITGTPNEDTWPGVTSLPDFKSSFPRWPSKELGNVIPNLDLAGLNLLKKMLCLDPSRRITARSALEHEYFKDIGTVP
ncbi:hypothetical protein AG4045_016518 [Apium graveolens]|nr:hypothetical protein AG4045_016518 [Apium graveolens]